MSSSHAPAARGARTAIAFLSFARHCVLKKAGGLSEEQLRRVLIDSGTCILGLVQHLAETERHWFGYHLAGAAWDAGREYGMTVSTGRAAGNVLRATGRPSRTATVRSVTSATRKRASSSRPTATGTRFGGLMAHMTSETARHAGHANILRELLDGTTGR
jgi:hypothetical protein